MAAAVADFRPKEPPTRKLKKHEGIPEIVLEPTHDFLVDLGRDKPAGQVLVGFAAETDDLLDNAADKLRSKRLDLIVGNDISQPDAGFEVDTNRAVILDADGGVQDLPLLAVDARRSRHERAPLGNLRLDSRYRHVFAATVCSPPEPGHTSFKARLTAAHWRC